jgi:SAM-dependent methyltransferase
VRGFPYCECSACRALFVPAEALPAGEEAPQYEGRYLDRTGREEQSLSGYFDYEAELALHVLNFQRHLGIVRASVSGSRLLDVGCASGHFLLAASQSGFDVNGIDVSHAAIEMLRSRFDFPARAGDPSQLPLEPVHDAITLWETLEHLADPRPTLEHLKLGLRPGGRLFVGTGDNQSALARTLGSRWWYLTPPDHVIVYNQAALTRVLADCGYRIQAWHRVSHQRVAARNVVMKLLRSLSAPAGVALPLARATPDLPLWIPHGTTMVAVAAPVA